MQKLRSFCGEPMLLHCRIQNALIHRTFFQQLLFELCFGDDAFLKQQLRECISLGKIASMSSSRYRFAFVEFAIVSPI
jgi:hypothetical protein